MGSRLTVACPGWRTAVNLRGVKKDELAHGDALATPGVLRPTRLLDAELTLLPTAEKPVKRGQTVFLYYGTAEVLARVYPLGQDEIEPGETALAQFRLAEDAVVPARRAVHHPHAFARRNHRRRRIVDPYPQKHTRADDDVLRRVQTLARGTDAQKLAARSCVRPGRRGETCGS